MRLHTATERASRRHERVPLSDAVWERVYVHGTPYILVPDITRTGRLHDESDPTGVIGAVAGSAWMGLRHEDIGPAQGWYYPADRRLVIWACFPAARSRASDDPLHDRTLRALWSGLEAWLRDRFPEARRLVSTSSVGNFPAYRAM